MAQKTSFSAVIRILRAASMLETRLGAELGSIHGLSLKDVLLLLQLEQAPLGRLRPVDLAARLSVSQSTVSRMAAPLAKIGLVRREPDPRDTRVAYVTLTETGRKRAAEAFETLQRQSADLFRSGWTREEIAELASLTGRLTAGIPGDVASR
jgi:DNA-binding MarR family transcriptional regulator